MHKDPNLRKRNGLVIPGGLLTLVSIIGLGYVALLRGDQGTCEDPALIVLAGACRSAYLALAIPLVIGLALVMVGALKFRSKATCRHGWGSGAHFGLAVLIALVLLPALGMVAAPSLVGEDAAITRGNVDYPVTTVLAGLTLVGVVALAPYLALYVARGAANRCCQEKGCFEPCFCDEPIAPAEEPAEVAAVAPPPQAEPEPLPPQPEPEPLPPAPAAEPAAAPAPEVWTTAEEPAEEAWEVVPDEPAPAPRKSAAPPLASRPTDPAAPPQDAMAVAAKWAEEDAEAAKELAGSDKPARVYKPASNVKKAPPKKATAKKDERKPAAKKR